MKLNRQIQITVLSLLFFINCSHTQHTSTATAEPTRAMAAVPAGGDWIEALPQTSKSGVYLSKILEKVKKGSDLPEEKQKQYATRIAKYLSFLLGGKGDPAVNASGKKLSEKILERLFQSSTQFILCPNLSDFACLEKTPEITPSSGHRVEDPALKLGEVKVVNDSLDDNLEWFFTTQIFERKSDAKIDKSLASQLEKKIREDGQDEIYMAVYGIDDIEYSMKGVYDALVAKIKEGVDVKAVFDHKGPSKKAKLPLIFTYVEPKTGKDRWILNPLEGTKTNLDFQYNAGTQGLIRALAKGAKNDNEARGRLEWPNQNIMHNKFLVLKKGNKYGVWTGTANVADTCMGTDRNSNMGIYLTNKEVAQAFIDEFNEMYEYRDPESVEESEETKELKVVGPKGPNFPYGRFHKSKKPNSHRYFKFKEDGSEVRVYFSPTDDAEHRAILPMLHSAKSGDIIHVSMFGGAGIEYVRAFELAQSRGVDVQIIIDSPTGFAPGGWVAKKADATLLTPNPFAAGKKVDIKVNTRGEGDSWKQNHQKIGVLLRKSGSSYIAEQLIIGSQNWSLSGNDVSDENLVAFRNLKGLKVAEAFEEHFSEFLWPKAKVPTDKDLSAKASEEE